MELENKILSQVNTAIGKAITGELVGYNKPLSKLTERVVSDHEQELYDLINCEFEALLNDKDFKEQLKIALNAKLAKTLISRMGGELEKQVNTLKADPTTRAKITLAIDGVLNKSMHG